MIRRHPLVTETWLVLGVSLGASAIWSLLAIIDKLTLRVALSAQTTAMNTSVTPDRPWLDLLYQLTRVGLGVSPALLAVHLLQRDSSDASGARRAIGWDLTQPGRDLLRGLALAALIGIPGLGLYLGARSLGVNTQVAAANLAEHWWSVPMLVALAIQNAVLEEVVMVGYLFSRWRRAGWGWPAVIGLSALIRGCYHLYQGFGGFVGNIAMGVILGLVYRRWPRVMPLVIAHAVLDIVAFVGYTLVAPHVSWL